MNKVLVVVAVGLALTGCQQKAARPGMGGMPVVPVSVAKVSQESVPTELQVVGTVEASAIVQAKSEVAGELMAVHFTEGQNVAKGDLLFEIDPRPYDDALRQALAAVERDKAQIAQAEAALARDKATARFAQGDAERQAELNKGGLTPHSVYDQAVSSADAANASARSTLATIDTAKAALDADQAAVERARLDLVYCQIRAPISGRTGNLLVHAGNLVKVNDVPLVVIHQVSPIFVNFAAPEQYLGAIRRLAGEGRKLAVKVESQDDPGRAANGSLAVIDNTVDSTTGTIHLKATFENADHLLWPGQFVTATLTLDTIQNAVVAPAEAVQSGQQGYFVYAVKPDNHVEIRPVTMGRAWGAKVVIASGLRPGETVVTDGQMRIFPGAQIAPVDPAKLGTGPL
ncbi:MAG: efflux RND transporter periplasmic adaptor subunit [Bryobacteraceae bacterium]